MPEPWQRWVKHDVDAWQGSAVVQEMTDAEYRGYHNLLQAQFQQPDGMLPSDERELAKLSRKRAQWQEIREEVLAQFENGPDGRIYNPRMYHEWCEARDLNVGRKKGGKTTAEKRRLAQQHSYSSSALTEQKDSVSSAHAEQQHTASPAQADHAVITERNDTLRDDTEPKATNADSESRTVVPEEPESIAAQIVCAHPIARTRKMHALEVTQAQLAAVFEAINAECTMTGCSRPMAEEIILTLTQDIAAEVAQWPPGDRQFLSRIERFFREREYRKPLEEWTRARPDTSSNRNQARAERNLDAIRRAGGLENYPASGNHPG